MSANCVSKSKNAVFTRKTTKSKLICNNFYPFNGFAGVGQCFARTPRFDCVKSRNDGADLQNLNKSKFLPNTTIIALGANLKNPIRTFIALFHKLKRNARIHILQTSPIYKNPPFGYTNQPFFYNATMILATSMRLMEFYAFIFYMERIFGRGRIRAFKNAPRTLDIDIIFFNDIFLRSAKLNIPHPQWQNRASVLIPLYYGANFKGQ